VGYGSRSRDLGGLGKGLRVEKGCETRDSLDVTARVKGIPNRPGCQRPGRRILLE